MKFLFNITWPTLLFLFGLQFVSCKKDKLLTDAGARIHFSQDSVLFDTVFTSIGSSTRRIQVRNKNKQKIKISSIQLAGGSASFFKVNVDGAPGTSFSDLEIAAEDSMFVFLQVKVDPNNSNSPFIIRDSLVFMVNGQLQSLQLEAWGQNAYYHYPVKAIKFKDGTFLPYSFCDSVPGSFTMSGGEIVWNKDKPHVIYGYCVVDSAQKLRIDAGTRVYLNNRASLWVYKGGQLQVLGQKGNEVLFQAARRERGEKPGQWDRIWINEGSNFNKIDYAIIKGGFIGIQAELIGDSLGGPGQLTLTNTKIMNMSKWGLYCFAYKVYAGNNVISNCQEHSLNIVYGGTYEFRHCTFANYWSEDKPRELATVKVNNYSEAQTLPVNVYFGNCIIDGKLDNELIMDLKADNTFPPQYKVSSSLVKTTSPLSDAAHYIDIRKVSSPVKYKDVAKYDFEPDGDSQVKNFLGPNSYTDLTKFPTDINIVFRNASNVVAGAYDVQ